MRTKQEILDSISSNKSDFTEKAAKGFMAFECVMDYTRGWIAALEWVLAQQEDVADKCPDCGGGGPLDENDECPHWHSL